MKRNVLTLATVAVMALSLTACKEEEPPTVVRTGGVLETTRVTTTAPVTEATEEVTEATEDPYAFFDKEAATEVGEFAQRSYESIKNKDYETMAKTTNLGLYYYMSYGVMLSDEDFAVELQKREEEGNPYITFSDITHDKENFKVSAVGICTDEEVAELQTIIDNYNKVIADNGYFIDVTVDNAYQVYTTYDGMDEDDESYYYVIESNGELRLDTFFQTMKGVYDSINESDTIN